MTLTDPPEEDATQADAFRMRDYPFAHLLAVHRPHFNNMSRALRRHDVTPQMWRVLAGLTAEDGQSVGDLARVTATERSNLSRILDAMEGSNLIRRLSLERDKRFAQVFLTDAGRAKHTEILPTVREQYDFALRGLTRQDIDTLVALLRRIKENLGHIPD